MTPRPTDWKHPASWPLRSKLVASMVALFIVITLGTGTATILGLRAQMLGQTNQALQTSLSRLVSTVAPGDPAASPDTSRRPRGPGNEGLQAVLTPVGSAGTATDESTGARTALTTDQLGRLAAVETAHEGVAVNLGGTLGNYQVMTATTSNGAIVVVGLPLGPQDKTVRDMILVILLSTAIGLIVMGAAGTWLIRRNLRPLDRVAATAAKVSQLQLSSGSVDLADRVPETDTDTRTEVGQVGAALNEMLDHVGSALTARHESELRVRQFVADASHELRTPLASIRGYAELSRRETSPVPEGITHALSRIEAESVRMSALVEDLLLLARLDSGRPLERDGVDLTMLVVDAVSDARAASRNHTWRLDLPEEPVEALGDPMRLHQVVANLLGNARTHTPDGTVVTTTVRRDGDTAFIKVNDNGPGVPESLQHNVFQRFTRGDGSRNRAAGSTGLGLSIVSAVVDAHHGSVAMTSRPGDTTFTVTLPVH